MDNKVTQADRDVAAPILRHLFGNKDGSGADVLFERDVLAGKFDEHYIIQALCNHRNATAENCAKALESIEVPPDGLGDKIEAWLKAINIGATSIRASMS